MFTWHILSRSRQWPLATCAMRSESGMTAKMATKTSSGCQFIFYVIGEDLARKLQWESVQDKKEKYLTRKVNVPFLKTVINSHLFGLLAASRLRKQVLLCDILCQIGDKIWHTRSLSCSSVFRPWNIFDKGFHFISRIIHLLRVFWCKWDENNGFLRSCKNISSWIFLYPVCGCLVGGDVGKLMGDFAFGVVFLIEN